MQTEGERIFNRVRELLQTVPPDDKLAPLAGSYVSLLDSVLDQKGLGSLCDFCEAAGDIRGTLEHGVRAPPVAPQGLRHSPRQAG